MVTFAGQYVIRDIDVLLISLLNIVMFLNTVTAINPHKAAEFSVHVWTLSFLEKCMKPLSFSVKEYQVFWTQEGWK